MASYEKQIAMTAKAIAKRGMPVVFVHLSSNTDFANYDPATGTYAANETRLNTFGLRSTATQAEVQGYGFGVGSVTLYMPADVVTKVSTADYVLFGGHRWNIVTSVATAPAESALLFLLELKDAGEVV
ncbi:MAG: hypothetical protein PHN64_03810 [Desulfovibrionaceae bacterium]|nr:hypothetical protein [Desulfovibrionaceae bacterium]